MEKKVRVKSLVSNRIVLSVPDLRLRRVWERKNAINIIPFDQLEEAMYSPGVESLFTEGILGIDDMDTKIALGLEPEEATKPINIITLTDDQRKRYLTMMPLGEFKVALKTLPHSQIIELAHYAIEHQLMDYDKVEVIKGYTGIDIATAIKLNRDDDVAKEN